jgi:hypothetical protein
MSLAVENRNDSGALAVYELAGDYCRKTAKANVRAHRCTSMVCPWR